MTQEITKDLRCIVLRNGIEIWFEAEKLVTLEQMLASAERSTFIKIEGEMVNTADISGVFTARAMEELNRKRNGQWKCQYGTWHGKSAKCQCAWRELTGAALGRFSQG